MKSSLRALAAIGLLACTLWPQVTAAQNPAKTPQPGAAKAEIEIQFFVGKDVDKDVLATVLRDLGLAEFRSQVKLSVAADAAKPDSISAQVVMTDNTPYEEAEQLLKMLEKNEINIQLRSVRPAVPATSADEAASSSHTDPLAAKLDESIWKTAQELAEANISLGPRHPKIIELQTQLRSGVTAAFEARQRVQRAQLKRLQSQHARIETLIANREKQKQQIIDKRIAQILKSGGDGTALEPIELVDESAVADEPKIIKAPSADAVKLFELQALRWKLGLQAFQSGNTTTEAVIEMANELHEAERGAAKNEADIEAAFANHIEKLEMLRKFAQSRFENGVETQASLLAAEVALLKARLKQ